MTRWSDDDVTLLARWVRMGASLYAADASDAAVISGLSWQMTLDWPRDDAGIKTLIAQWAAAVHEAGAEMREGR